MKKSTLDNYIGLGSRVTTFDGEVYLGFLQKTGTERLKNHPNLYIPQNYYYMEFPFLTGVTCSPLFRSSHVKKIELQTDEIIDVSE